MKTPLELKNVPKVQAGTQLGVFGRIPRAGRVKTRLAAGFDPAWVAGLYRAFLADTLELCATVAGEGGLWLFLASGEEVPEAQAMALATKEDGLPAFVRKERLRTQVGGTLGERITHALAAMLEAGPAIVVGSDAPDLPVTYLEGACAALAAHDLVLGPTVDGGYYLIGARAPIGDLLEGIPWSTPAVFEETRARALARGWAVSVLAPWRDVDEPADLEALRARLARGPDAERARPRRTVAWLTGR